VASNLVDNLQHCTGTIVNSDIMRVIAMLHVLLNTGVKITCRLYKITYRPHCPYLRIKKIDNKINTWKLKIVCFPYFHKIPKVTCTRENMKIDLHTTLAHCSWVHCLGRQGLGSDHRCRPPCGSCFLP
jgi:hypothetical protein